MVKPVWIGLGAIALLLGSGLGALLGSVNLEQGTTLAVVTGMGAILSSGWLSRRILKWVEQQQPDAWHAISMQIAFVLGAINLAVALVIGPIALWRVVWPTQQWPWILIGSGLGCLGAAIGGVVTVKVVSKSTV